MVAARSNEERASPFSIPTAEAFALTGGGHDEVVLGHRAEF